MSKTIKLRKKKWNRKKNQLNCHKINRCYRNSFHLIRFVWVFLETTTWNIYAIHLWQNHLDDLEWVSILFFSPCIFAILDSTCFILFFFLLIYFFPFFCCKSVAFSFKLRVLYNRTNGTGLVIANEFYVDHLSCFTTLKSSLRRYL